MKTMKWLLRREFWEHKGALYWAPLIVGIIMVTIMSGTALYGMATGKFHINTESAMQRMPVESRAMMANVAASSYMLASVPLFGMLAVISFFYCLSALFDERRDRSILFWKSLPMSDQTTVLSKVLTAAIVAPVITIAIATAMSLTVLFVVLAITALNGVNLFGAILSNADLYLAPLRVVGILPVYVLWALPTIGWLLMVSAWARSKVFLWAVGTPLIALAIVKWLNFMLAEAMLSEPTDAGSRADIVHWFATNIVGRGLGGLVPGNWFAYVHVSPASLQIQGQHGLNLGRMFEESWMTLATPGAWIGAVAGIAMIYAAVRLRRYREEG